MPQAVCPAVGAVVVWGCHVRSGVAVRRNGERAATALAAQYDDARAGGAVRRPMSVSELSVSADARTYEGRPYTVLVLAGRLDTTNRAQLRQAVVAGAREATGLLVVDLSQLEHLDGQALYELVRASHVTRQLGVGVALVSSD